MAQKLAHFLVESTGESANKSASIVTFTIQVGDQKMICLSHLIELKSGANQYDHATEAGFLFTNELSFMWKCFLQPLSR